MRAHFTRDGEDTPATSGTPAAGRGAHTAPSARRLVLGAPWSLWWAVLTLWLADTGFAIARGWKAGRSRLEMAVACSMLALAAACSAALASAPARKWVEERRRELSALTVALLVALLALEGGLWLARDRIDRVPFHLHQRRLNHLSTPQLPGTSPVASFTTNSLGLRGPEPPASPATYRIVAVGGSTTECLYLDQSKTWTALLMARLNALRIPGRAFWVAGAGRSGYATAEHLAFIRSGAVLELADAVVLMVGINDLARMVWGKDDGAPVAPRAPDWTRSRLLALAARAWELRPGAPNPVMDLDALFVRDARLRRHEAQVIDGGIDIFPHLESYRERLRAIVGAARNRGLSLVLVDQPVLFKTGMTAEEESRLWLVRRNDGSYLPPGRMRALMDRYNQVTREVALEQQVPLVDLGNVDGDSRLLYDDCHFTEAGAAAVASAIADQVDWAGMPARKAE